MSVKRILMLCLVSSLLGAGCGEAPPCDRLVQRLCGAVGEPGCTQLTERAPTDQKACEATLADPVALNAQLDALVAATAAGALEPKTATPGQAETP